VTASILSWNIQADLALRIAAVEVDVETDQSDHQPVVLRLG